MGRGGFTFELIDDPNDQARGQDGGAAASEEGGQPDTIQSPNIRQDGQEKDGEDQGVADGEHQGAEGAVERGEEGAGDDGAPADEIGQGEELHGAGA